jgi:hypothetical protein
VLLNNLSEYYIISSMGTSNSSPAISSPANLASTDVLRPPLGRRKSGNCYDIIVCFRLSKVSAIMCLCKIVGKTLCIQTLKFYNSETYTNIFTVLDETFQVKVHDINQTLKGAETVQTTTEFLKILENRIIINKCTVQALT